MYTYKELIERLNHLYPWARGTITKASSPPEYIPPSGSEKQCKIAFAVSDMANHMSQEGWEIMLALQSNGYTLAGKNCTINSLDVKAVVEKYNPTTVLLQDHREWDPDSGCCKNNNHKFTNSEYLASRVDIFKGTIVKDAQHNPTYHKKCADSIGSNYWIVYYNPKIVCHMAPYVRPEHVIRTWHTIDPKLIPPYTPKDRKPLSALLSGAISRHYPLRQQIKNSINNLQCIDQLVHPGYHNKGSNTPKYLQVLSRYKVAICTSSIYGYALRKIIEATACGCAVITDLPDDEVLPLINDNLVHVHPGITMDDLKSLVMECLNDYDSQRQKYFAEQAIIGYNFKDMGKRLVDDIEDMRQEY